MFDYANTAVKLKAVKFADKDTTNLDLTGMKAAWKVNGEDVLGTTDIKASTHYQVTLTGIEAAPNKILADNATVSLSWASAIANNGSTNTTPSISIVDGVATVTVTLISDGDATT